jgi:hypothetical protein
MSRRRAHRFLNLGICQRGLPPVRAPGRVAVPAPSAQTLTIGELGLEVVHQSAQSPAFLGFGAARLWYPFVVHGSSTLDRAKTARLRGVVALLAG